MKLRTSYVIGLGCCLMLACTQPFYKAPEDPLFETLPSTKTGISFRNDVQEDSLFNEMTYRNFFNGGGVALGDINNDGLVDVFMTANQGKNKLYLNKGGLQFEDITEKAGIFKGHLWSTGTTMADVNGDGLLDLYVCSAGSSEKDPRNNQLFINRGNLRFTEEAAAYHLQDAGGYHTQAAFFDYDLDGDLDAYLLNNDYRLPVGSFPSGSVRSFSHKEGGDKLLRNDANVFTDVSQSAGIYGSNIAFGLGITTGDLNGDSWPDIYISNDFFEKDYLYINQGNGTFKERSDSCLGHMSQSSMGADMADLNNDGLLDIFSTDMLPEDDYRLKRNTLFDEYDTYQARYAAGFHHQLLGNMLHLNNGDETFSEIAQFAGVDATDWSWGALIFDLNNDGWKDIFVCNGMYLSVTDQDYVHFKADENNRRFLGGNSIESNDAQLKGMMASTPLANYAFVNNEDLSFQNKAHDLGLGMPAYSNGAAYADLDMDGDLDLVVNNLNQEAFVYKNLTSDKLGKNFLRIQLKGEGRNRFGIGAFVVVYAKGLVQTVQNFPTRGFQSCVEPTLVFGLDDCDKIDSVVVHWPSTRVQVLTNMTVNTELVVRERDALRPFQRFKPPTPLFENVTSRAIQGNISHKEDAYVDFNTERLMPHMISEEGPKIAIGDINNDGLEDFFIGSARGDTSKMFLQTSNGDFKPCLPQTAFVMDWRFEDADAAFLDVDKDGDLDLIVVSGGNLPASNNTFLSPRLYLNNGKGIFTRDKTRLPPLQVNASCVKACDFDRDGDTDLFIGARSLPGNYGIPPDSYLLQNEGGLFKDATLEVAPGLKGMGMVTDAAWADVDEDNQMDLMVLGEWMPITLLKNKGNRLDTAVVNRTLWGTKGWWNCLQPLDMDNDGDLDFVAGNVGKNTKFRVDSLRPGQLYVNDFDKNGTRECVAAFYKKDGRLYPYYLRGDMVAQMPYLKKRFLKFADYAGKSIYEIFTDEQLRSAFVRDVQLFQSIMLINNGHGEFTLFSLPTRAQLAPVYGVLAKDLNKDGIQDLFLVGNKFGLKPELGRYDANWGTLLLGQGNLQYRYSPASSSGLFYRGAARDVVSLPTKGGRETIIIALNNQPLQLYRERDQKQNTPQK